MRGRRAGGILRTGHAAAAVFGEITHDAVHRGIVGRINDRAAFAPLRDKAGIGELSQVKAHRRRRNIQLLCQQPSGDTLLASLHQQTKCGEAMLLRQGSQCADHSVGLHHSFQRFDKYRIIELERGSQACARLIPYVRYRSMSLCLSPTDWLLMGRRTQWAARHPARSSSASSSKSSRLGEFLRQIRAISRLAFFALRGRATTSVSCNMPASIAIWGSMVRPRPLSTI